jgi:hypothetical protein
MYLASMYVWLAATDEGRVSGGDYHWSDGSPVAAGLWHKSATRNEPNNAVLGQKTCVYLWTAHHSLGDWKCDDNEAKVLCQLPEEYNSCIV